MSNNLKTSVQRVQDILKSHNLGLNVVQFQTTTRTSQEAADTIGCTVAQIAKTLIFKTKKSQKPVCVIASGVNRVDEKKIANYIGEAIERPDADFVREHTGFAIGGVSPVGYEFDIKPLIDEDLMKYEELWAAAGAPDASFRLTPQDLIKITHGTVADIKKA